MTTISDKNQAKKALAQCEIITNNDGTVDQTERQAAIARGQRRDNDNNPPGPIGGPGTNWENKPGPQGGPGASPNRRGGGRK